MTEQRDDDALSWAGDDDPTLDASGDAAAGTPRVGESAGPVEVLDLDPQPTVARAGEIEAASVAEVAPAAGAASAVEPELAVAPDAEPVATAEREQMSSAMLVTLGIFGGVFLLYSVGWLISAFRPDAAVPSDTVGQFMFNLGQALAVAAGPVWMAATLWLTRGSKPYVRIAMLAAGVVLVLPWPFLQGV